MIQDEFRDINPRYKEDYKKAYNRIYKENLFYDTTEYLKVVTREVYKTTNEGSLRFLNPLAENRLYLKPGIIFAEKDSQRHCMIIAHNKNDYLLIDFDDDSYGYYTDNPKNPKGYAFNTYKVSTLELNSQVAYNKETGILNYNPNYSFVNLKVLPQETDLDKRLNLRNVGYTHFPRYLIKRFIKPTFFELVRNIFTHATIGDYRFMIDWYTLSTNQDNKELITPEGIINVHSFVDIIPVDDEDGFDINKVTIEELFTNYALSNEGKTLESLVTKDLTIIKTDD